MDAKMKEKLWNAAWDALHEVKAVAGRVAVVASGVLVGSVLVVLLFYPVLDDWSRHLGHALGVEQRLCGGE